ncbi:MAG: response regulator [Rhodospirillales bacterium]|nr:response regulator [Acetobacter sp.]
MTADRLLLKGCRVLIVEDEYLLAMEFAQALRSHGILVVGPVGTLADAEQKILQGHYDVVALDIKLNDDTTYGIAADLKRQNIPFFFVTGYDAASIPAAFADVLVLEKPCDFSELFQHLQAMWPLQAA